MSEGDPNSGAQRVLLVGASGTIGHAVALKVLQQGYALTCVLRDSENGRAVASDLEAQGAQIAFADLANASAIAALFDHRKVDSVVSCIASRTGEPSEAQAIDYQANCDILKVAESAGVRQMILLSALCVQKPKLAFQRAKLAFEAELKSSRLTWSIVRPTAFFKSLSGQIERVRNGKPFLMFGDGELTRCKPISDADLARFIVDCVHDETRHNRVLPIGGPGPAITPRQQGEELFRLAGKEPKFRCVRPGLLSGISGLLAPLALLSKGMAAKREYARIGHYYATESMLVWDEQRGEYDADATPEFGETHLFDHYRNALQSGGDTKGTQSDQAGSNAVEA